MAYGAGLSYWLPCAFQPRFLTPPLCELPWGLFTVAAEAVFLLRCNSVAHEQEDASNRWLYFFPCRPAAHLVQ